MSVAVATRQSYVPLKAVPLAELAEFRRGLTYKKSDEVALSSNAVLRANNIDLGTGSLDLADVRFISDEVSVPVSKKITADSLLICTASGSRSHLGKVAYIEDDLDYAFGGFMGLIVPGPQVLGKFLYYFTRSNMYSSFIDSLSAGANINNLRFSDLGQLRVPVPRLDEQKRIVAVLDQAFAALDRARAHAEANLVDANELLRSVQITAAANHKDWITAEISTIIKVRSGDFLPSKAMAASGTIPVFGGNGQTGLHDKANLSGRNILIGRVGAKCGNVRVVDGPIWLTDNAFHVSKFYRDFDLDFLALILSGADLRRTANQAAQPAISGATIGPVEVRFPESVEEQKLYVRRVMSIEVKSLELLNAYEQKVSAIANLRQSLLQKAFSGELA